MQNESPQLTEEQLLTLLEECELTERWIQNHERNGTSWDLEKDNSSFWCHAVKIHLCWDVPLNSITEAFWCTKMLNISNSNLIILFFMWQRLGKCFDKTLANWGWGMKLLFKFVYICFWYEAVWQLIVFICVCVFARKRGIIASSVRTENCSLISGCACRRMFCCMH